MRPDPYPMTPPKIVLFDWDGTLVDSHGAIVRAMDDTLIALGRSPLTDDDWAMLGGKSARDAAPIVFGADAALGGRLFYEAYAKHIGNLEPLPGVISLLTLLKEGGVEMAVVSNKRGPMLRAEVERLGWQDYFSAIVGAEDASHDKPHAAPAEFALLSCVQPFEAETCWFVGDQEADLGCALALGCTAVWVGPEAPPAWAFEHAIHKKTGLYEFTSCQNILNFISSSPW